MNKIKQLGRVLIILPLLISFSFGQLKLKDSGVSAEIVGGKLDVLNVYGPQIGLRIGFWPTSFLQIGGEGTVAAFMDSDWDKQNPDDKFFKLHFYSGLHLRIFKSFHPYIIGSVGPQLEYIVDDFDDIKRYNIGGGGTIKVGISLEFDRIRLSAETGRGNLGTGHVENNLALSYVFKPIPQPNKVMLNNFNIKAGYHTIFPFSGPYSRANGPGFDITLETNNDGVTREYNAGIFFTNYTFNTGVFNIGTGWRLDGDHAIFDYVGITPGFQALIWAEGEPDFILPAFSLGLGIHTELGKFIPFINTRTLLTYSKANEILFGTTFTAGIGWVF